MKDKMQSKKDEAKGWNPDAPTGQEALTTH